MRRVQQASIAPFRCAVIPFMGNQSASGFIDTGMDLIGVDPHVYVSFEGAVEIAKEIGWVGPSVVKELEDNYSFIASRCEQLEAELAEANKHLDAIDFIATGPMKAYKKQGRPKKEVG
jgi:hypothetical protein